MTKYLGIEIDYNRDEKLTDFGKAVLRDRYLTETEKSPQEAFARAATTFADNLEHAQRIYEYASNLWFMFATPILSNGGTKRGLPISCFLNYVDDSRQGLSDHYDENIWLASNGGGIGGYWGHVRSDGSKTSNGSKSTGSIPFLHVVDSQMLAFNQGTTRRGSYAAYMDISHPEIEEFMLLRKPTGGDMNRKSLNLHHGVNVSDKFMQIIEKCMGNPDADDSWDLIDPNSDEVVRTISAKELWARLLEARMQTGEPYIHFIDRSNEYLPRSQKMRNLKVWQSNLCSEITLATDELRTAVCCLSSLNLATYDEWCDHELFIEDMIRFLDNVLGAFVSAVFDDEALEKLEVLDQKGELNLDIMKGLAKRKMQGLVKAAWSAHNERSLGMGTMGFHTLLQKRNMPFESAISYGMNMSIFEKIQTQAIAASEKLADEKGEPPDMINTGRRNAHLIAIAPNASSSIICGGTSPSIEPIRANIYNHKTLSGSFVVKNPVLLNLLEEKGENTKEVWKSINQHGGSVQHLEFLTDWEKEVFKTAMELDQSWIIEHAGARQKYICQSQSLNLFFRADEEIRYLHDIHFSAWKKDLKTLYYCRSEAVHRAENVSVQISRQKIEDHGACLACEG
jgi:ribonucleoside-diphosphate reductase alpha chain